MLLPMKRVRAPRACVVLAAIGLTAHAAAQSKEFKLDQGGWVKSKSPEPGTPAATIGEARELLAKGQAARAKRVLRRFIESDANAESPLLPEAFFLRGDARLADGDEEDALRDYEQVVRDFPGCDQFVPALEREHEIALKYLGGMRRRVLGGLRLESGVSLAEEILIRICERLPGSVLAERSLLALADHYYKDRDLRMAVEAYDVFLRLFPKSEYRERAMQRQIFANIARFKGPAYDASGLVDAKVQIRRFSQEYPASADRAGMSDALAARLDESAAAQMLDQARWYLRREDVPAARGALRRLVRTYPGTVAATRAVAIMQSRNWLEARDTPAPAPPVKAEAGGGSSGEPAAEGTGSGATAGPGAPAPASPADRLRGLSP